MELKTSALTAMSIQILAQEAALGPKLFELTADGIVRSLGDLCHNSSFL